MDLGIFSRNTTDKVSNQKTRYYAISNTCVSALPGKTGNVKIALFHSLNSTSCCLISAIFLTHDSNSCCCMTP